MGLQSLDALAMIMQTLLPLATTLTPALEVRSIDGVDWASVLSAVIDGSPIVYRDDGEKRLCPVTFASQPQRLLFECDAAVPSLSSMMDGLNDTYAGVGLSVHLNGQVAPPDVPAMHLDLYPKMHWLPEVFPSMNAMSIVCSCRGQRAASIFTRQSTKEMLRAEPLVTTTTGHLVPIPNEASVLDRYEHWDVLLEEGDCVMLASYAQFHKFSYTPDAIGVNHRLVPRGVPVWLWQRLMIFIALLGGGERMLGPELAGRRVYALSSKDFLPDELAPETGHAEPAASLPPLPLAAVAAMLAALLYSRKMTRS